jgi:serine/threonine protein kinase
MGAVYLAEHTVMDRLVALKTIKGNLLADNAGLARFRQEIKAVARLAHPNIVTAYDADQAGELHFLVLEYVEGVTLEELVARQGPLPVAQACAAIRQAALGLDHAHRQGLVHRDIKPSNLMWTANAQVKILDFGLARLTQTSGSPADPGLTGSHVIMGTGDYIAPEQTHDCRSVDIRADIYSLGCTLYFLLSGQPPFPGGSFLDKLFRHTTEAPRPLAEVCPAAPAGLAAVVERMMAKRPEDRFQSPADVAEALAPYTEPGRLVQATALSKPAGAASPASFQAPRKKGRRRLPWTVAAAVCALTVLTAVGILLNRRHDPAPSDAPVSAGAVPQPKPRSYDGDCAPGNVCSR